MFLRTKIIPRMYGYTYIRMSHKEAVRSGLGCELVRESSGNVGEAYNLWSNVRLDEQVVQIRTWFDLASDTLFATDAGTNLFVCEAWRIIKAGIAGTGAGESQQHISSRLVRLRATLRTAKNGMCLRRT